MSKPERGRPNFYSHILLISLFIFCLVPVLFTFGCSGGNGGSAKPEYHLTGYDGFDSSAGNQDLSFYSEYPWYVNMTFQVRDRDGVGVPDLKADDFTILENGAEISHDSSELNISRRDSLPSDYTYTLKTVLLLDNTPSSAASLDTIKAAAQTVVDNRDEQRQQLVAVVAFDEAGDPVVLQDFTSDTSKLNQLLAPGNTTGSTSALFGGLDFGGVLNTVPGTETGNTEISNIQASHGTTNFYGAVIKALSLWDDEVSPSGTAFEQGVLVAVTDGNDTSNMYDIGDALARRGDKQVITVAVGSDNISQATLDDLQRLGNAGFYPVKEPDRKADQSDDNNENLSETLLKIQDRVLSYADGFYWLQYKSMTTSQDEDTNHTLALSVKNNKNKDEDAEISGTFSSEAFFSGKNGISLYDTDDFNPSANPEGLAEKTITLQAGESEKTVELKALALMNDDKQPSQFEWKSNNKSVVTVKADDQDDSKAVVTVVGPGETTLVVNDTANGLSESFKIVVTSTEAASYEFMPYKVQSAAPWFVDATFHVRQTCDEDTQCNNQWMWVPGLIPENFSVAEDGTPIDPNKSELNLRKRDAIPRDYSYTLKTVLLIDNTPSMGTNNLDLIKQAAESFVKRVFENDAQDNTDSGPLLDVNGNYQQEIAIQTFDKDGNSIFWLNFSSDEDKILNAIDKIEPSYGTTQFYQGMIDALTLWNNEVGPPFGKNLVEGMVVALTDGYETFRPAGSPTPDNVLGYITGEKQVDKKQVITVGVGDSLASQVSDDLKEFGNDGFYSVPAPGEEVTVTLTPDNGNGDKEGQKETFTNLQITMREIQDQVVDFANSFYWLDYKSYQEPATDCTDRTNIKIAINNNTYKGAGSTFQSTFKTCEFVALEPGRIYINSTAMNPEGEQGPIEMNFIGVNGKAFYNPYSLVASTYAPQNTPDYGWTSNNKNLVGIDVNSRYKQNSHVDLVLPSATSGSTSIQVVDNGNSTASAPPLTVTVSGTYFNPVVFYPFSGNVDDESGNGYDGLASGAELTTDRFGDLDSAYSFNSSSNSSGVFDGLWLLFPGSGGSNSYIATGLALGPGQTYGALSQLTVCAWIKTTSGSTNKARIVDFDIDQYWALAMKDGHLVFIVAGPSSGNSTSFQSSQQYNDGEWHLVCVTYEYDITAEVQNIYVDGVLDGSAPTTKVAGNNAETRYGFIGINGSTAQFNGGTHSANAAFTGDIDDVMILTSVLTQNQINALFEFGN